MINVGKKSKILIHWNVSPYDFSKEKENSLISKVSRKYGIPKDKVSITPVFKMIDERGNTFSLSNDIITNIQNPSFQLNLFKEYLKENHIEDYDFDIISEIDREINSHIDYQVYDKYRRYSIKWVKWSNFLSYGKENFFDFSSLHGLVLLNGRNQSGKTTLALDLIRFLLFGNTTKYQTQDRIFNKFLPEETKVEVEGCINIDGFDYIIKRTLSRPSLSKRTDKSKVTQKVEYYKIIGSSKEELEEYVDIQQEENSIQTNKKIKEVIGREDDFDLVMSVTDSTLDALIEKKDTERGRLFSRWIGLLPIEEKDVIARDKFNKEVKPYLISNTYNIDTLKEEISAYKTAINDLERRNDVYETSNKKLESEIKSLDENKNALIQSKSKIDEDLLVVDITTLNSEIDFITNEGKKKKYKMDSIINEINDIGEIDFSVSEYDEAVDKRNELIVSRGVLSEQYKSLTKDISVLKASEYCPTCGKKMDNVDNSKKISELEHKLDEIVRKGKSIKSKISEYDNIILNMKDMRDKYNRKSKLTVEKSAYEVNLERLRNSLLEKKNKLKEYNKNKETIDKNNNLDIQIRNITILIEDKRSNRDVNNTHITNNINNINLYHGEISKREDAIKKINEENVLVKNWKIYLDMIGKNGISKMVLRKTLPIINARLSQLLSDVCDFDVEVGINLRNEVAFYILKNGVRSDLSGGSGFEKTAASLALRSVLADISIMPRGMGILVDEVMGRVDEENYDNMHNLFMKMLNGYDYILSVNHIKECKDWFDTIIDVEKIDNVSKVNVTKREN